MPIFTPKIEYFMFIIVGIMLSGVLCGYLVRNKNIRIIHKIITALIWLLLLILGLEVGHNESIIQNIDVIGLEAIYITLGAVIGSILASWLLWYLINRTPISKRKL